MPTETHGLGHGEVPLVTAGQAERRDGRGAVLSCRRWHEGCGVEPEQTILIASRRDRRPDWAAAALGNTSLRNCNWRPELERPDPIRS